MSLLSQPGIAARDLVEVLVVGETPNPRGEEYAPVQGQVGDPVKVVGKPLSGRERFEQGKTASTVAYQLYADLAGSEHLTVKRKLWHPAEGARKPDGTPDFTKNLLDVTNVQRFGFGEDIAVVEAERTY